MRTGHYPVDLREGGRAGYLDGNSGAGNNRFSTLKLVGDRRRRGRDHRSLQGRNSHFGTRRVAAICVDARGEGAVYHRVGLRLCGHIQEQTYGR